MAKRTLFLKDNLSHSFIDTAELKIVSDLAAAAFAHGDREKDVCLMAAFLRAILVRVGKGPLAAILLDCANRLREYGVKRTKSILLSLHTAREAVNTLAERQ